ncbi:hypothetical protein INT45_005664 [Circinella minor]|uniref:RING-type domain-containing protein n=1 Tax=Circinella minor TaxID=1195481 RepID=A0A8H7VB49_9FUNG|nr:hypothetical protein INT45_005664 [Circinella minor]
MCLSGSRLFVVCIQASLFSSSNPYISEETVTLYSNTSSIDSVDSAIEPQNYKQNIVPNTNLTQPDASGLSGVLYDRGLSCGLENTSDTPLSPLLTDQRKIALVRRGNCSFEDKVIYSQMDGAVGVIIYDQIPFEKDPRAGIMNIPPGNITIAVYYVDLDIGVDLLRKLQQEAPMNHDNVNNASYQKAVKVSLYPAVGGFPSAWEFTLIVVVALLAVSFLASVGMHYHLWRIRRRQRLMFENGLLPPPFTQAFQVNSEKKIIDPSMLPLFPTRTIGREGEGETVTSQVNNNALPQSPLVSPSLPSQQQQQQPDSPITMIIQRRNSTQSVRSTRSEKALRNAEALATAVDQRVANNNLSTTATTYTPEQHQSIVITTATSPEEHCSNSSSSLQQQQRLSANLSEQLANVEVSCVICLDEFSSGDTVRKLPCGHEYHCECIDPWLTIKSASCPLCKHDCSLDVPKITSDIEMQPDSREIGARNPSSTTPSRTNSPFSIRFFGGGSGTPSSATTTTSRAMFGPTIRADQAEEFSRSWMVRSLPRNMRRQIHEAALAHGDGPAIELPFRMTGNNRNDDSNEDNNRPLSPPAPSHQPEPTGLRGRISRSLPRQWRSR